MNLRLDGAEDDGKHPNGRAGAEAGQLLQCDLGLRKVGGVSLSTSRSTTLSV